MKEKLEVTVVNHRNNRDREYHLGMYISEMDFYTFRFPVKDSAISCSKIGHTAQNIARHLNGVDGIEEIFIRLRSFTIVISPAYGWDEIENDIFHTLELMFGKTIVATR
ncbi:TPA: hypothetical protein DDY47_02280 [candidate division WWE3 bacterium]|uniref:Scaffold protein Nfu/NifU N-terminal domain-containing protein n=4 Tax=Katanobacteria TaxID=422282 RepID=A0A1F4XGK8_UNCKA|nr:MAG: hypothetical protein UU59_C0001G0018 [candidate division WWE3 bacterium GW2011_GWE1_41_27]KKS60758.1 MAG: hypothetical protein UV26_C0002G0084 [candidate division WWE3 bacterium GW2011_GWF2_42_42]OGC80303.1 MAG: hypothetical protein A3K01_03810 [candidate division WWE3 bacterium RIFOXYD1_FULL_43_17]HBI35738.1 hypothetical protein [candidate division WWE3 bacterium]